MPSMLWLANAHVWSERPLSRRRGLHSLASTPGLRRPGHPARGCAGGYGLGMTSRDGGGSRHPLPPFGGVVMVRSVRTPGSRFRAAQRAHAWLASQCERSCGHSSPRIARPLHASAWCPASEIGENPGAVAAAGPHGAREAADGEGGITSTSPHRARKNDDPYRWCGR